MTIIYIFASFLLLMIISAPVAYSLAFVSLLFVVFVYGLPASIIVERMIFGVNEFTLLAVPFFILAGNMMTAGGMTRSLVLSAKALIGRTRGGLSHTAVVACMVIAGMTGSDLADASAAASILLPAMREADYPKAYGAAIIAAAATAGPIIPPSIAFVIYGYLTNTSVAALFLAGFIPGLILGSYLMITGAVLGHFRGFQREQAVPLRQTLSLLAKSLPALGAPLVILGGIFTGIFTPTEAAAVAVAYALVVGRVVYRELDAARIKRVIIDSLKTSGAVFFIVATSATFSWVLALQQVGLKLAAALTSATASPLVVLLLVNVVFLLLGCVMESMPIMLIFVPIIFPAVIAYGVDPVHFGVMVTLNLMIGLSTPPFGLTMFLVNRMAGISMAEYCREYWPFLLALLACLLTITIFPTVVLILPNVLLKG